MSDALPALVTSAILANLVLALVIIRGIDGLRVEISRISRKLELLTPNEARFRLDSKDSPLGRRVKYRADAKIQAVLKTGQGELSARLEDLSETGALLQCDGTPPEPQTVCSLEFEIEDGVRVTTDIRVVRLIEKGRIGVSFDGLPIDTKTLIRKFVKERFGNSLADRIRED